MEKHYVFRDISMSANRVFATNFSGDKWLGMQLLLPLLALPVVLAYLWQDAAVLQPLWRLAIPLHEVFEALHIAGAVAIFSVGWFAPHDKPTLRSTLVACAAIPTFVFSLLSMMMLSPQLLGSQLAGQTLIDELTASFAHSELLLLVAALALTPEQLQISCRNRRGVLAMTVVAVVFTVATLFTIEVSDATSLLSQTSFVSAEMWPLARIGGYLYCALHLQRRVDVEPVYRWAGVLAAILFAISEGCRSQALGGLSLDLLGHTYFVLGFGAIFLAVYAENILPPYRELAIERTAAVQIAKRTNSILSSIGDGVVVVDSKASVEYMNPAARSLFDIPGPLKNGSSFSDIFGCADQDEKDAAVAAVQKCVSLGVPFKSLRCSSFISLSGGHCVIDLSASPQAKCDSDPAGAVVVVRDVSDIAQVELQMHFQAECDPITILPNRNKFVSLVERALSRNDSKGKKMAVLLLDLDDFRNINDTLGHAVGDRLLAQVSGRLLEVAPAPATVARLGGDEFGIMIDEDVTRENVMDTASRLMEAVGRPINLGGLEVRIACSVGVSMYPADADNAMELLRNADTAMYRAKEVGKNSCLPFSLEMTKALVRRSNLVNGLRSALARNELRLEFQPKQRLVDQSLCGVEALLRWDALELGPVSPAEFIPIAEATGSILDIGRWVLLSACRQAAFWFSHLGVKISVAVNVSARQFHNADFLDVVSDALATTGLSPEQLELELTESMLMRDPVRTASTLHDLKHLGVRLAIDDFGTGFSSLSYLKRFPLDVLKIDRSFVQDVLTNDNDLVIVDSIIGLAHKLGLDVVAEGVEAYGQIALLQTLGCNQIQGYYYSRPLTEDGFQAFLVEYVQAGSKNLQLVSQSFSSGRNDTLNCA